MCHCCCHHPDLAGFVSGAGITRREGNCVTAACVTHFVDKNVKISKTILFWFVFQEKDILAETSCRLAFLPPWGFYTHAGFLTCCTTMGEGAVFILLQINVLLLQVIIFVSDFFKNLL